MDRIYMMFQDEQDEQILKNLVDPVTY